MRSSTVKLAIVVFCSIGILAAAERSAGDIEGVLWLRPYSALPHTMEEHIFPETGQGIGVRYYLTVTSSGVEVFTELNSFRNTSSATNDASFRLGYQQKVSSIGRCSVLYGAAAEVMQYHNGQNQRPTSIGVYPFLGLRYKNTTATASYIDPAMREGTYGPGIAVFSLSFKF